MILFEFLFKIQLCQGVCNIQLVDENDNQNDSYVSKKNEDFVLNISELDDPSFFLSRLKRVDNVKHERFKLHCIKWFVPFVASVFVENAVPFKTLPGSKNSCLKFSFRFKWRLKRLAV